MAARLSLLLVAIFANQTSGITEGIVRGALAEAGEPIETLSPREREVFDHIAAGLSNAEVAQALYLTEATVKTHITRVLAKLGLRDRVQVVIYAYERGLR